MQTNFLSLTTGTNPNRCIFRLLVARHSPFACSINNSFFWIHQLVLKSSITSLSRISSPYLCPSQQVAAQCCYLTASLTYLIPILRITAPEPMFYSNGHIMLTSVDVHTFLSGAPRCATQPRPTSWFSSSHAHAYKSASSSFVEEVPTEVTAPAVHRQVHLIHICSLMHCLRHLLPRKSRKFVHCCWNPLSLHWICGRCCNHHKAVESTQNGPIITHIHKNTRAKTDQLCCMHCARRTMCTHCDGGMVLPSESLCVVGTTLCPCSSGCFPDASLCTLLSLGPPSTNCGHQFELTTRDVPLSFPSCLTLWKKHCASAHTLPPFPWRLTVSGAS